MTFLIIGLVLIICAQRLQLHAERAAHRDTKRALHWWRDERGGHHGHPTPLYHALMADGNHVVRQRAGAIDGHQKCDGDHAMPICDDPECWQRGS
jgi:hypothetical protein